LASSARREKRGRQPGAARFAVAPGRRGEEKERKGRGEAGGWSPHVSEKKQKEKERGSAGWRGEEVNGPLGRRAERRKGKFLFFLFLFFFKLLLKQSFPFKFKPNSFKLFTKIL
jgi:hypothetical protein